MRKIIITGGAGVVGRHFCKRFLDAGDQVHCIDSVAPYTGGIHPNSGWPLYEPRDYSNFIFYEEDCRDYFKKQTDDDVTFAFHLAAMVGGRLMIEHNPIAIADDLSIDSQFWQWAVQTKPGKSICFSFGSSYILCCKNRR